MNEIQIEIYEDGLKLKFSIINLQKFQFDMLTACIKRNKDAGKIDVIDTLVEDDDICELTINGIERKDIPEFVRMIEAETLQVIQPTFCMKKLL